MTSSASNLDSRAREGYSCSMRCSLVPTVQKKWVCLHTDIQHARTYRLLQCVASRQGSLPDQSSQFPEHVLSVLTRIYRKVISARTYRCKEHAVISFTDILRVQSGKGPVLGQALVGITSNLLQSVHLRIMISNTDPVCEQLHSPRPRAAVPPRHWPCSRAEDTTRTRPHPL